MEMLKNLASWLAGELYQQGGNFLDYSRGMH